MQPLIGKCLHQSWFPLAREGQPRPDARGVIKEVIQHLFDCVRSRSRSEVPRRTLSSSGNTGTTQQSLFARIESQPFCNGPYLFFSLQLI